jgi:hypothetical protein
MWGTDGIRIQTMGEDWVSVFSVFSVGDHFDACGWPSIWPG